MKFKKLPLDYLEITQPFGARPEYYNKFGLRGHEGLDFRTRNGKPPTTFWNDLMGWRPVYTVNDGVAEVHYGHPQYGTHIYLQHDDGSRTHYAHLKNARVGTGQRVLGGDIIAVSGRSGTSAPHLHFAYRPANPDYHNGYYGEEDPTPLFVPEIRIARIGLNLPPKEELRAEVSKYTKEGLNILYADYSVPVSVPGSLLYDQVLKILDTIVPRETFVQIYYSGSPSAWAASYQIKGRYVSLLPNRWPANLLAYEFAHCLEYYCHDKFGTKIVEELNVGLENNIRPKYDAVEKYLGRIV